VTGATLTVGRNAAVQILGRAAAAILGLGLAALLTRSLGFEGYGSLSTALAVLGLLAVLHDLGVSPIAVRTLSRQPERSARLLGSLIRLRLATAVPLAAAGVAVLAAVGEGRAFLAWVAPVLVLILLVRSVEIVDVSLQVAQRLGRSVGAALSGRAVHLAVVAVLAAAGIGRAGPMLAASAAGVLASASLRVRLARPWVRPDLGAGIGEARGFLREAVPSAVAAILMAGYMHADAVLVRGLAGAREAALYNAPYRLFALGAGLPGMVMIAAAPVLAARWTEDRGGFRRSVRKLLLAAGLAGPAVAAGVALLAEPLLDLLFGPGYGAAARTLRWLAFAAAFTGAGTVATAALLTANRAAWTARLAALALVTNVGLDLLLVPRMGGEGAAIATLAAEGLVALLGTALLLRAAGSAR
jgi:O-antigen/teichoic acid export membrane protein